MPANSASPSVTIHLQPTGQHFQAHPRETVLDAALRQQVRVPFACRSGTCGCCKARVVGAGQYRHAPSQPTALTAAEQEDGYLLLCCAHALSDLSLEVPEPVGDSAGEVFQFPARVILKQQLADDVVQLRLRLPKTVRFTFRAGQFVNFMAADGRRRSFSIANSPNGGNELEFHIRRVPSGTFTGYVFDDLKEQDVLHLEGPFGTFRLSEHDDRPAIFLAGGTGFAPFKAILEDIAAQGITRPITFYWGGRTADSLYMAGLVRAWEATHPKFRFVPVISDPDPDQQWSGRTGFVHRAVVDDFTDLRGAEVYACGSPPMIEAARLDFTSICGLSAEDFHADPFTAAA